MGSKWQMERKKDPYYRRAKAEDYRSRASYKLKQLDKKYKIIKQNNTVVDLGAAPGGWSQIALEKVGEEGIVVGVDLNHIKALPNENYYRIKGDFTTEEVHCLANAAGHDDKFPEIRQWYDGYIFGNTEVFRPWVSVDDAGYIQTEGDTPRTGIAGIYAAGDVADPHYRQAVVAAGSGAKAAIEAEKYLKTL